MRDGGSGEGDGARVFHKCLYFNLGLYEVLNYNLKNCFIIPNVIIKKGNFPILELTAGLNN